jgi:diguanylate cyclase (GGDEF)-like protein
MRRLFCAFLISLLSLAEQSFASLAESANAQNTMQRLHAADAVKSSNNAEFAAVLRVFAAQTSTMTHAERSYWHYLAGWQKAYQGDFDGAIPMLLAVLTESPDKNLEFRAIASLVNVLAIARRYTEAFTQFHALLTLLPDVTDDDVREQGLLTAAFMHNQVGQYELALDYAAKLQANNPAPNVRCKGLQLELEARYKLGILLDNAPAFAAAEISCMQSQEFIFLNLSRTYVARLLLKKNQPAEAIKFLTLHRAQTLATKYPRLISEYEALLAEAYWASHNVSATMTSALAAVENSVRKENTEPLVSAFRLLYLVMQQRGDSRAALEYHKNYMAADTGLLDDISARQLAYEKVKQQTDALNKQNKYLQLQDQLARKKAENARLYIVLLLVFLASIVYFAYRTKRSQLHFRRLASLDGLTGINNRHNFISEAETALEHCKRQGQNVCVMILDLDHFKKINDTYGHPIGDVVLQSAVAACSSKLRKGDLFGRLGGEEFGILVPDCDLTQAENRAEEFRAAVATCVVRDVDVVLAVTASFGLTMTASSGFVLRQLLTDADRALYRAKDLGRNQIAVFHA